MLEPTEFCGLKRGGGGKTEEGAGVLCVFCSLFLVLECTLCLYDTIGNCLNYPNITQHNPYLWHISTYWVDGLYYPPIRRKEKGHKMEQVTGRGDEREKGAEAVRANLTRISRGT